MSPKFSALCRLVAPLLCLLLAPACQSVIQPRAAQNGPAPVLSGKTGRATTWAELQRAIDRADVVLLGEQHTDAGGHALQLALLQELLARQPKTALTLEFLERDEQPLIERYRAGSLSAADFIALTQSSDAAGTNSWVRWYQPLVDAALAAQAPVYGANPPRYLTKLAREKGYDALKALPAGEQPYFTLPVTQPTARESKRFTAQMQGAARSHGGGGHAPRVTATDVAPFLRAQELWNGTMAQSILTALDHGAPKVVHVVGAFHIEENGGIVRELHARKPGLKTLSVLLDPEPKGKARGRADFVIRSGGAVPKAGPAATASTPVSTATRGGALPAYLLNVSLDPPSHKLSGRARITLPRGDAGTTVGLELNPGLRLLGVQANGGTVQNVAEANADANAETSATASRHGEDGPRYVVTLKRLGKQQELFVWWEGEQYQDAKATENAAQIHNFAVRATIGGEGVYLSGAWYPRLSGASLAHYELGVAKPAGTELVASGQREKAAEYHGTERWYTNYPVQDYVLVGGPLKVTTRTWRDKEISVYLRPEQESQTEGLLETIERNLERYEPLLGPLPVKQYRIVDNFFSSGYAFPGFTLLSSGVIAMGPVSQKGHGYIDHELVHTWWGCGVQADEHAGNWSEALTSYCTNYYGFVLDGDARGARKYLRDASTAFSKLSPEQDVPLARFGTQRETSRIIGYNKGAVIFHLLEQQIGQERFFQALRQLTAEYTGQQIGWKELRAAFEQASGQSLGWFFTQWVEGAGAAELDLSAASWSKATRQLQLTLAQPANLRVTVPFVIRDGGATSTLRVEVQPGQQDVVLNEIASKPQQVALDPDYHVLRRVAPADWVPTLDLTRRAEQLAVLVEPAEKTIYTPYIELFDTPRGAGAYRQAGAAGPKAIDYLDPKAAPPAWAGQGVLIVGQAARSRAGRAVLGAIESPVKLLPGGGFSVEGKPYTGDDAAVLATFAHPTLPGAGVTLILGNSSAALPRASILPFYPNSVVVFAKGRPVQRLDLERERWLQVTSGN